MPLTGVELGFGAGRNPGRPGDDEYLRLGDVGELDRLGGIAILLEGNG